MARAGESLLGRTAIATVKGAAQGALGGALLAPAEWWLHTQDGSDATFADALQSVIMSAGMGAAFHGGGRLAGDVFARLRGVPLPIPGVEPGLAPAPGPVVPEAALGEGIDINEIPGVTPPQLAPEAAPEAAIAPEGGTPLAAAESAPATSEPAPAAAAAAANVADGAIAQQQLGQAEARQGGTPVYGADGRMAGIYRGGVIHPAQMLADLPAAAQEDVVRASIANLVQGEPKNAAEMLVEAAKADPRIAESVEPYFEQQPQSLGAAARELPELPQGARIVEHGEHGPAIEGLQDRPDRRRARRAAVARSRRTGRSDLGRSGAWPCARRSRASWRRRSASAAVAGAARRSRR